MAVFSDLPNELIIYIWGYVIAPEDVENFALVSKRVYGLATSFVRGHARLKQQWSNVFVSFPVVRTRAADVLEKMLLNPRITLYINEFVVDNWAIHWDDQKDPLRSYPRRTMDLFKDAIWASSFISSLAMEDWVAQIEMGDEDPILALIFMQLTRLKKLRLSRLYSEASHYQLKTLRRITQSSKAAIQPGLLTVQSEIHSDNQVGFPQPSTFSNVSDLSINFCDVELGLLSRLLRSMREIRSFSYSGRVHPRFEPYQICNELLDFSQHSLQSLRLRSISHKESHMGNITDFKILTELEIDLDFLLGSKDETYRRFADKLPKSIERVTLLGTRTIASDALREVVLQMAKSKMKRLPNLKALTFDWLNYHHYREPGGMDLIALLAEKCAEVGILLRFGPSER